MMNRRTLPLAMLFALALAHGAHATEAGPGQRPPAMDPARMTERMGERLGLSPEQSASVQKINERFVADMQKQRERMDKAREEHRQAVEKLAGARDSELKKVLNEEQYRQHAEQQATMRERWRERREHGGGMHHRGDGPGPRGWREPQQ